mmetsp:Transcript_43617/g.69887  ORF Transcript_43617/g.69887 Transcript_43617/m.69887 type:complete len:296 (+) Transcript_43617:730-1617(+)
MLLQIIQIWRFFQLLVIDFVIKWVMLLFWRWLLLVLVVIVIVFLFLIVVESSHNHIIRRLMQFVLHILLNEVNQLKVPRFNLTDSVIASHRVLELLYLGRQTLQDLLHQFAFPRAGIDIRDITVPLIDSGACFWPFDILLLDNVVLGQHAKVQQHGFEYVLLHFPPQQVVISARFGGALEYLDGFLPLLGFAAHVSHFEQALVFVAGVVFCFVVIGRLLISSDGFVQMVVLGQHIADLLLQSGRLSKAVRVQVELDGVLVRFDGFHEINVAITFSRLSPRGLRLNVVLRRHVALR